MKQLIETSLVDDYNKRESAIWIARVGWGETYGKCQKNMMTNTVLPGSIITVNLSSNVFSRCVQHISSRIKEFRDSKSTV